MGKQKIQDRGYRDPRKLFPHDYLMKYIILPFFPRFVRPNHLTVARFLMTPVVFWLLLTGNYRWGIVAFIIAAFTDAIDGSMARVRDQITEWGTAYDPVSDKILISSVLILLMFRHLNIYLASAIVALEILHVIGGIIIKRRGGVVMAFLWGKIKMVLQAIGVALLLIYLEFGGRPVLLGAQLALVLAVIFSATNLFWHIMRDIVEPKKRGTWGI